MIGFLLSSNDAQHAAEIGPLFLDERAREFEIEIFFRKTLTQLGDASLTTLHVLPLGSRAAREIGTFRFKTKATPPQEISGKYVVVWRRIAGQWKLATDIWNANE